MAQQPNNADDQMFPSNPKPSGMPNPPGGGLPPGSLGGPPQPGPGLGGTGQPPLTPGQADGPHGSDKNLRRGLLIAGISVVFLFIAILVVAVVSSGQGTNTILEQIGVEGDINQIILRVVNFVFGIAGMIAVISTVIGAFIFVISSGNEREKKKARRVLIASVSILVLLLFSYILIFTMIKTNQQAEIEDPAPDQIVQILTNPSPAEGSAPLSIGFDIANLEPGSYFYTWEFGDGEKGTGRPISHTYQREGNYTVQTAISEGNDVLASLTTTVTVSNTRPSPIIIAEPVSGRAPLDVRFDASKSRDANGEIISYKWDFGDSEAASGNSNTAEGQLTTHTYTKDGFYEVTLTIADNNNETESTIQTIEVGAEPDAPTAVVTTTPPATGFAPLSVQGVMPFKVNFSGAKSRDTDGQITGYRWDFGDGSSAESGQAVNHTFTESGTYITTLTVTDNASKEDVADVQVIVGNPDQAPVAQITSNPPATHQGEIRGDYPLTLELDGMKSSDPDGEITLYEWNMGDNSPLRNGRTVSYTYEEAGTYTLTLEITDDDGYTNMEPATLEITVFTPGPQNPVASIKTEPESPSGNVPFTVNFDASGSFDEDGSIISYEWDFGDGRAINSGAEVTHVYDSPGIYTVELTVHDNEGLTGEVSVPVAAHIPAPIARIEANRTSGNAPLTVIFDGSESTGEIKRHDWEFGDGTSGRGRSPRHTFSSAGEYTVTLIVTDTVEQVDSDTITIEVR